VAHPSEAAVVVIAEAAGGVTDQAVVGAACRTIRKINTEILQPDTRAARSVELWARLYGTLIVKNTARGRNRAGKASSVFRKSDHKVASAVAGHCRGGASYQTLWLAKTRTVPELRGLKIIFSIWMNCPS
jgi:hypothetical protein